MRNVIDLNADIGEDPARLAFEVQLLQFVTSANIACGGHAGDERSMVHMVEAAHAAGVEVGAHPSYPDREHFGRSPMSMAGDELLGTLSRQIAALGAIAEEAGIQLRHVKPHGALYHAASADPSVAEMIGRAALSWSANLILVGFAGSPALSLWRRMGFATAAEAFVDRRYEADGALRSRSLPGAVLAADEAAHQALKIVEHGEVLLSGGDRLRITADSLCIHGDTPEAIQIAHQTRSFLVSRGIRLAPLARC